MRAQRPWMNLQWTLQGSLLILATGLVLVALGWTWGWLAAIPLGCVWMAVRRNSARSPEQVRGRFFSISPDMLCVLGYDGWLWDVNPAWERTLGYTRAELLVHPFLDLVHREDRPIAGIALDELRKTHEAELAFACRMVRRDGSTRLVEWRALSNHESRHIYATARDVSERQQAEAAAERARAEALSKSRFLATMSHEIRTPLNGIIGLTELVLDSELTADQQDLLLMVQASGHSLLSLVDDVLDLSKIEAGRLELESIEFDLGEALGDIMRTLAAPAQEKGLELMFRIEPGVPKIVVGDPGRLRQVVTNLVGNAVKFTDTGEVMLQVETRSATGAAALIQFAVSDTGAGIPVARQKSIFEAFTQADASITRQYGGTGLGLTICSLLVELMGGRIGVESEVGCGSTFHFTAAFGVPEKLVGEQPAGGAEALRGLSMLVVDDNANNRLNLKRTLQEWGAEAAAVDGARPALQSLEQARRRGHPFSLLLVDAHMPELDGFALVERLQQSDPVPTIVLTSTWQKGDAARCRALGVPAHVTKPVKASELLEAIESVLSRVPDPKGTKQSVSLERYGRCEVGLQILLVEDNDINQKLATHLLERRGHSVLCAGLAGDALSMMDMMRFDRVLMDVQLPDMDGCDATTAIRYKEKATGGHIPIIAMTAHAMKGDRERCMEAGMDGYVSKPLRPEELFAAVEQVAVVPVRSSQPLATPDEPIDRSALFYTVDNNHKLLLELVGSFLVSCPQHLARIEAALEHHNARDLEQAAHLVKGAISVFCARPASDAAQRLESMGRSGDLSRAREAFDDLRGLIEQLGPELVELAGGVHLGSPEMMAVS